MNARVIHALDRRVGGDVATRIAQYAYHDRRRSLRQHRQRSSRWMVMINPVVALLFFYKNRLDHQELADLGFICNYHVRRIRAGRAAGP